MAGATMRTKTVIEVFSNELSAVRRIRDDYEGQGMTNMKERYDSRIESLFRVARQLNITAEVNNRIKQLDGEELEAPLF